MSPAGELTRDHHCEVCLGKVLAARNIKLKNSLAKRLWVPSGQAEDAGAGGGGGGGEGGVRVNKEKQRTSKKKEAAATACEPRRMAFGVKGWGMGWEAALFGDGDGDTEGLGGRNEPVAHGYDLVEVVNRLPEPSWSEGKAWG